MEKSSQEFDFQTFKTNDIKVNYLYVCERKLWLFDRGIQMESKSDRVLMGKILGEYSYPREMTKEILIDNLIKHGGNNIMQWHCKITLQFCNGCDKIKI